MNLLPSREIILRALTVCPLLYVGQLWQLMLAYDPRTSAKRKEGKRAFDKWAKAKRRQISDLLKELVEKKELGTFEKQIGYRHEPIVTAGPLLRVEPKTPIKNIAEAQAKLYQALDQACGSERVLIGYYRPLTFPRNELSNPFYLRAIARLQGKAVDRREASTIEAFRIGSVYVSQVAFNRSEAETFALLHRQAVDAPTTEPHAGITRKQGMTHLFAADTTLVDDLQELSRIQERSESWLELWL